MRHSFLRADTKNRFPCSRPWPEPCAGTKGAFAVPPGLKRFQRVGKARLRRSFPTGHVSPPRKYRRSARWARAALVFAHAFGSLWAFGPTAHRADASHRRLRRGRGNARWIRISLWRAAALRTSPEGDDLNAKMRFHLCLRLISGAGRRGLAEEAQRRGRAGVRDRPRSRGGGSLGTGQGGARFSRVSGAGPGTGVFYHRRPGFATGK